METNLDPRFRGFSLWSASSLLKHHGWRTRQESCSLFSSWEEETGKEPKKRYTVQGHSICDLAPQTKVASNNTFSYKGIYELTPWEGQDPQNPFVSLGILREKKIKLTMKINHHRQWVAAPSQPFNQQAEQFIFWSLLCCQPVLLCALKILSAFSTLDIVFFSILIHVFMFINAFL